MSAASKRRVQAQPGWVLHTWPWRETSLIAEVLTCEQGRLSLVAKGARRPTSPLRGQLMAFQPLLLSWHGAGELKTLTLAAWQGGLPRLGGEALLCGYYLNELILKLTAREDPHPGLFSAYGAALAELATEHSAAPALRRFELALLTELGYAPVLEREGGAQGAPVRADGQYVYLAEHGPAPAGDEHPPERTRLHGQTLLDMAHGDFSRPRTLAQAKTLLRELIEPHLHGKMLTTRRIFQETIVRPPRAAARDGEQA